MHRSERYAKGVVAYKHIELSAHRPAKTDPKEAAKMTAKRPMLMRWKRMFACLCIDECAQKRSGAKSRGVREDVNAVCLGERREEKKERKLLYLVR